MDDQKTAKKGNGLESAHRAGKTMNNRERNADRKNLPEAGPGLQVITGPKKNVRFAPSL